MRRLRDKINRVNRVNKINRADRANRASIKKFFQPIHNYQ